MALRMTVSFCRLAPLLSWEPTFIKTAKHYSTDSNLMPMLSAEAGADIQHHEKLKRYALLIGYRGENYYGVCMNPGQENFPTVGKEIISAMVKLGDIDESYLESAKSMSQASRTDTGVSALRQLVVMDLKEGVDLDKIQQVLSKDIKLYGMVRTTKRFIPYRFCTGRSYLYYMPSFVFSPLSMEMLHDYRLTNETKEKIQRSLEKFLGIKNYHNFTRGRSYYDPRARRKINTAELLEPVLKDGLELTCIRLQGDSFILNQIRKIIAALVLVGRGLAPEEMIDIALSDQGLSLPRAPPFGLMLENMDFTYYNKKVKSVGFEPIDFSKNEAEVEALKDRILSGLVASEMNYEKARLWAESLQYHGLEPFSKEQRALDLTLEYDDTLNVIRSDNISISGKNAAALFI